MKKLLNVLAIAGVALAGLTAAPVRAQDDYGRYGYQQNYGQYGDDEQDRRYERYQQERQDRYRHYRAQAYRGHYYARPDVRYYQPDPRYDRARDQAYQDGGGYQPYRNARRCHSGTTGAILGAVVGGLLGREIGRGGEYNDPSTTGLILGAGGGALAGRAIERNGCH